MPSPGLTPSERSLRSQIAAHESWARTDDPAARTAPARAAALERFEREIDPDNTLPAAERARRAEHARKAHFARLALQRRHRPADDPDVLAAEGDLAVQKLAEHIRKVVDAAPSLTAEQIERLRGLLPALTASPIPSDHKAAEPDSAGRGDAA